MTVPFPVSVRVGYREYRIVRWDKHDSRAEHQWGQTRHAQLEIRVCEMTLESNPVESANTLLHEILHACWSVGDIDDKDEQEKTVTVLANQLTQVWRDNPSVVAWLDAQLGEPR